jgi:hypothetical protein
MMESYRCFDIGGVGACRTMQNVQKNMINPWWGLLTPLIPLAGWLGGQGDEASIGLANFDKQTVEETRAAHPELGGSWDELLDNPKLNIDAMAYRMMDLGAMLPAQLNTTYSRKELIRMGYRTGVKNMLEVATGQSPDGRREPAPRRRLSQTGGPSAAMDRLLLHGPMCERNMLRIGTLCRGGLVAATAVLLLVSGCASPDTRAGRDLADTVKIDGYRKLAEKHKGETTLLYFVGGAGVDLQQAAAVLNGLEMA